MPFAAQQTVGLRARFTAHLAQTTRLLQLSTAELTALIESELAANPALELVTVGRCAVCGRRLRTLTCPICDRRPARADEALVYLSARSIHSPDTGFADEIDIRSAETLAEYVRRQIAPALPKADQPIVDYLLGNLDEHGFLIDAPEMCAATLSAPLARVLEVWRLIQRADPPGVGARDVRESLLIQLDSLDAGGADRVLARALIADCWEQLGHRQFRQIANQLRVTPDDVEAATDFIRRNLTPYPAQTFWGSRRGQPADTMYAEPDVLIHATPDGALAIELLSPTAGWLRVNEAFRTALDDCPAADRARLAECIEQADLLVRGLQHRTVTLRRMLEIIARAQRAYLTGDEPDPQPMTRARLAQQLNVHESTVSRAVAGKLIRLPTGRIAPLDHFFDHSLAARRALKTIIADEQHPLTDGELVHHLAAQGHVVARRTVAKYRDIEHIPPAGARGQSRRLL